MKLTPIHVVQANQIRRVPRVLLSGHLYHRVHPFQAFQGDLATSLHRHRIRFPFLDRIAADDDEIIISRKGAISSHDSNNNNNNEVTTSKLQASLLIKCKRFKCSLCGWWMSLSICGLFRKRMRVQILSRLHITSHPHTRSKWCLSVKRKATEIQKKRCFWMALVPRCQTTRSESYESCLVFAR